MAYEDLVQQFYVGFYGRPADPAGLAYWSEELTGAGGDFAAIQNAFANSDEYEDYILRDELGQPRDNEELVNFIYNNLFGRDAEPVGLNFWVGHLEAGNISLMDIVTEVIEGALGTDKDALANKVAVATYFTDNLRNLPYTGADIDDVQDILAGVTSDPATVDSGEAAVDDWLYETLGLSLTAGDTSVDEGEGILFTLSAENGTPGDSYGYTISGVSQSDVVGGQLTGTVTLDANGVAVIQVTLVEDATTEGAENLTVTVAEETATVVVNDTSIDPNPPAYTLTADAADVDEGGTVQFVLQAANVAAGSTYNYTISGVQAEDVVGGQLSGTVTLDADLRAVIEIELVEDATIEGEETLTLTVAGETTSVVVNDTSVPQKMTFILTPGQDTFTGDFQDDTFLATEATLQNGDILDGADGDDILTLSVGGSDDFFAAPTLSNIEKIVVNSPNNDNQSIELDLSNADGYTTLESYQVTSYFGDGAFVGFYDIQNVNGTDIRIIDTNADHEFTYDTNAYVTRAGGGDDDIVNLYLSEVDGSEIWFGDDVPYTPGQSRVDQIDITSAQRDQINDTTFNVLSGLYVGDNLYTVMIDGDADLEIEDYLDSNVNLVDARELNADLTLSLWGQGASVHADDILSVYGAQGDDDIFIDGNGHNRVDLGTGNDFLWVIGDGVHNIALGEGNDELWIEGDVDANLNTAGLQYGVTTIDAGVGNDYVGVWGDDGGNYQGLGDYLITLGTGDDELEMWVDGDQTIDAGTGNDIVEIYGDGDSQIQAGDGNDWVYIEGDGNQMIAGGQGYDTISIWGDGDQTIDAGTENDSVNIYGDGVHWIDLGAGDDYLYIDGDRNASGNIDYAGIYDDITTIVGGEGNDTVYLDGDHYLNADLGTGDDWLTMHAQHLTTDDLIAAGEGIDRLSLLNQAGQAVYVGASETSSTTGVEIFDLWNSDITLKLTSDNFDTAQDKAITVWTTNSSTFELPTWLSFNGVTLSQGMSRLDYNAFKAGFEAYYGINLEDYLVANYVEAVDFTDGDQSGDENVYDFVGDTYVLSYIPANDTVFFRAEPGVQTIDITDVPLTVASGRSFTLEGGNIRDIVIADDLAINNRLVLNYDADDGSPDSILDTLVVIDAATITSADLRYVDGLEIIELKATGNAAQVWNIELSDNIINQTTGSADLIIRVDPNVAAGSVLNIQLDPSVINADNDVFVETVGNIAVYIDKGDGLQLVTEPDLGVTDYNDGYYDLYVIPRLLFTTNTDSLIGTNLDDLFLATSVAQLDGSDFADGNLGYDTLQLDFAVANPALSLWMQLENAQLVEIEHILFNTGNNVRMDGIGFMQYPDLEEITTGSGNDQLNNMREGLRYNLDGGHDFLSVASFPGDGPQTTVDGGLGNDTVDGGMFSDNILAIDVQLINAGSGFDYINIQQAVESGDVIVNGGGDTDTVNVWGPIGGTVYTNDVEFVYDSNWANRITATGSDVAVWGYGGNDTIYVDVTNDASVYGGDGNDSITVYADDDATVYGNDGGDYIYVNAGDEALVYGDSSEGPDTIEVWADDAWVYGGADDDVIVVHAYHEAEVYGEEGNDVIDVIVEDDATVDGGAGNDDIALTYADYDGITYDNWFNEGEVYGGDGDDTIAVNILYNDYAETSITGGAGNDAIILTGSLDGMETLFFGDIDYDAMQNVLSDTQGLDSITDFVFESLDLDGDAAPEPEDLMDFTDFLGDTIGNVVTIPGTWSQGDTVVANANTGNAIVVLSSDGDPALTPFDFSVSLANTIQLNDQGSAVIVVGTDQTGSGSGIENFNIYYVQDIDSTAGAQTWQVDLVATVESATRVGVEAVMDNLLEGLTIEISGTDGDDVLVGTDFGDVIYGGLGADNLTGGLGADIFSYAAQGEGPDTITDFNTAEGDVFQLAATAFPTGASSWVSAWTGNPWYFFSGTDVFTLGPLGFWASSGTFAVFFRDNSGTDAGLYYLQGSQGLPAYTSVWGTQVTNISTIALTGAYFDWTDIVLV